MPGSDVLKIGSTQHPIYRLYQLRVGPCSPYAPTDTAAGTFSRIEPCADISQARAIERKTHQLLGRWRVATRSRNRYNRNEWYEVSNCLAHKAMDVAIHLVENPEQIVNHDELSELITRL